MQTVGRQWVDGQPRWSKFVSAMAFSLAMAMMILVGVAMTPAGAQPSGNSNESTLRREL